MSTKPTLDELFEKRFSYPDIEFRDRFSRLVGLDDHKNRLTKILSLLINPEGLRQWGTKHHPEAKKALDYVLKRPPLVVLAGDVGSGKTEIAETIGDSVARQEGIDLTLFPLSLASRGQGRVGEMTQLISAAFDYTFEAAQKFKSTNGKARGGIILLVDEADALAQSRESSQMHHEDKAGVNAFIRGIDRLAKANVPAAVIMCTNRLSSLDPAVKRRAADILSFERPNDDQREFVLSQTLSTLGISGKSLQELVKVTGPNSSRTYGYSYSDITQRLIPTIILDAYPAGPVNSDRAVQIAHSIIPTPPFKDGVI